METENGRISLEKRRHILQNVPIFAHLNLTEAEELAELMEEVEIAELSSIVKEGDLINTVYFIIEGTAEVTQKKDRKKSIHLALLNPGDTIGLTVTGFFSKTSYRTATVTALSKAKLLALNIQQLNDFLSAHPQVSADMSAQADLMLKSAMIKGVTAFSTLSPDETQQLLSEIEIIQIAAGQNVFSEGDPGENCYLIRSGELVVLSTDKDGNEAVLASLSAPALFGETSLLTESPRNATVRAVSNCELFVISKQTFLKYVAHNKDVAIALSDLLVERSRPTQTPDVKAHFRQTNDGEMIVILKNMETAQYFRLSRVGWYIWESLDGKNTLQDITMGVFENFSIFSFETVTHLVANLAANGFARLHAGTSSKFMEEAHLLSPWKKTLLRITKIMEASVSLKHVDQTVTKLYQGGGRFIFTLSSQIILLCILLLGIFAFIHILPAVVITLKHNNIWWMLLGLIPISIFSCLTHELSHALTTKHFGYQVHRFGVGWYWIGAIAFADTSDMWLSTRGPRIMVNIAGMYNDTIWACLACIIGALINAPDITAFLWLFALFNFINVFRNLDVLLEFDGYYVMMDAMDKSNLRESGVIWLIDILPKTWNKPHLWRKHIKEISYWFACIVYLVLSVALLVGLQNHFAFIFPQTGPFRWILPILAVVLASLGVWADVRRRQKAHK